MGSDDPLDRLERLEAEAARVPWDNEGGPYIYARISGGRPNGEGIAHVTISARGLTRHTTDEMATANAEFIAEVRNALPALLAVARAGNDNDLIVLLSGVINDEHGFDLAEREAADRFLDALARLDALGGGE